MDILTIFIEVNNAFSCTERCNQYEREQFAEFVIACILTMCYGLNHVYRNMIKSDH